MFVNGCASDTEVEAIVSINGGALRSVPLRLDPASTTFTANIPTQAAGPYEVEVRSWEAASNNAGVAHAFRPVTVTLKEILTRYLQALPIISAPACKRGVLLTLPVDGFSKPVNDRRFAKPVSGTILTGDEPQKCGAVVARRQGREKGKLCVNYYVTCYR